MSDPQEQTSEYKTIACVADEESEKAMEAYRALEKEYDFVEDATQADAVIALGGDGFMLHTIHRFMKKDIPIFGMNCGTVGFLMNTYRTDNLMDSLNKSKMVYLTPLQMTVTDQKGDVHEALAINEVSLLRETKQAAHIEICIDGYVRVEELVCDGILAATPAGSTAYNMSVNGPIVPMGSQLIALTPVSPFRPRRWRGALLSHKAVIRFNIKQAKKRPVSAVADFTEIRDVASVQVKENPERAVRVLFDRGHSLEERIISEQFLT